MIILIVLIDTIIILFMKESGSLSPPPLKPSIDANLDDFYRLHYPQKDQKKTSEKDPNKFRTKSVISVT